MYAILFVSEEIFAVWLWPQLILCICQVIFVSKIYQKYQSTLSKFSVWTSQPQNVLDFLLFIVFITKFQPLNQDLITIEKMFLSNK